MRRRGWRRRRRGRRDPRARRLRSASCSPSSRRHGSRPARRREHWPPPIRVPRRRRRVPRRPTRGLQWRLPARRRPPSSTRRRSKLPVYWGLSKRPPPSRLSGLRCGQRRTRRAISRVRRLRRRLKRAAVPRRPRRPRRRRRRQLLRRSEWATGPAWQLPGRRQMSPPSRALARPRPWRTDRSRSWRQWRGCCGISSRSSAMGTACLPTASLAQPLPVKWQSRRPLRSPRGGVLSAFWPSLCVPVRRRRSEWWRS